MEPQNWGVFLLVSLLNNHQKGGYHLQNDMFLFFWGGTLKIWWSSVRLRESPARHAPQKARPVPWGRDLVRRAVQPFRQRASLVDHLLPGRRATRRLAPRWGVGLLLKDGTPQTACLFGLTSKPRNTRGETPNVCLEQDRSELWGNTSPLLHYSTMWEQ